MRKLKPSTAVAILSKGELALPDDIQKARRSYVVDSRSASTKRAYTRWWRDYDSWCRRSGRDALPRLSVDAPAAEMRRAQADLLDTISGFLTWLAGGRDTGKLPANSSMSQAFAALKLAIRMAQASTGEDEPKIPTIDFKHMLLADLMRGTRMKIAEVRTIKQAQPITNDDLKAIVDGLSSTIPREARDACLLTIGWGRRRSEIVGLDWEHLGKGKDRGLGFVTLDDKGITITLMKGKTHQTEAKQFVLPRIAMPTACIRLEEWVALAKIEPGTPLFRGVPAKHVIKATRLDHAQIPLIVRRRLSLLLASQSGKKKLKPAERKALVAKFSAHSLRSGFITSAAMKGVPINLIMDHSGHASYDQVHGYVRNTKRWQEHALKSVGW